MIDGVKISFYSDTILQDLKRLGVTVLTPLEEDTGEVKFPKYAEYRTLRFKIHSSNRVEIRGSLHIYHKGENYSDFTFRELYECVVDLCHKLNLTPQEARLHTLEFGVNVCPLFNPFEFCRAAVAFKNETFAKFRTTGRNKIHIGFEATQQRYTVKIYDKGKQYRKEQNYLRFEVGAEKMEFLKCVGVRTLANLCEPEKLEALGRMIDDTFSEVIILDTVNTSELSANERRIYTLCSNPKEWERFTAKERYKRKIQFTEILNRYGQTHQKETVAKLINEKWRMLLAIKPLKSGDFLTEHQTPKSGDKLTEHKNSKRGFFNRLDNTLLPSHHVRRCKSCGRDITGQKEGSVFCSERIYGAEAKKCRNQDSNPRKVYRYREQRLYGGLNLFEREGLDKLKVDTKCR